MSMVAVILAMFIPLVQTTSASPAGRWTAHIDAAKQATSDGGSQSRSAQTVTLHIDVKGSTVAARFTGVRNEEVTLSGTWDNGRLDLASEWREIPVNSGSAAKARVRWIIKGSLKDGVLGGTWDFQMGDSSLPQRWRAERAR